MRTTAFALLLLASTSYAEPNPGHRAAAQGAFVNWESPHAHPLEITPNGQKLLAVNTPDNRLEVFRVTPTGIAHDRSIPVGLDPVSVRALNDQQVWVVNHVSDSVSIVDLRRGVVIRTLHTDDEPADVVFAGTPIKAFVSCSQANTVLVFDPATPDAAPVRLAIAGEEPRALAVSHDGQQVYAAIFESGNGSTILAGGRRSNDPGNVVDDPRGPYGGQNPPPNDGPLFSPPINPRTGVPPRVGVIVRKREDGTWQDDNRRDWSLFVSGALSSESGRVRGWDLLDRDVAIIDTTSLGIQYQRALMTTVMSLDVHPVSGEIVTVGTEATNEVRFEPNLRGRFIRVMLGRFSPGSPNILEDLNPHLDYALPTLPVSERRMSLGDPRGIAWSPDGTVAYISGKGSNNVIAVDAFGNRIPGTDPTPVGEGPTGIVVEPRTNRVFVLNRFEASISVLEPRSMRETDRVAFFDPTPPAVRAGRPVLYNTHESSGLGQASCASCHVDGRHDRLAWDLGNPAGETLNRNGVSYHPMKGPMRTTSLVGIVGSPLLHFRGDHNDLPEFASAFRNLQGLPEEMPPAAMARLERFIATIHTPPNPYRTLDNLIPTRLAIPGPGNRVGNPRNTSQNGGCLPCHNPATNGRDGRVRPVTDNFAGPQPAIAPSLLSMYEVLGLHYDDPTASRAGFGFIHDGSFDSQTQGTLRNNDMLAFMLTFNGDSAGDTHAAVGRQVTLSSDRPATRSERQLLSDLRRLADDAAIGLVAHGALGEQKRGFMYLRGGLYQSDIAGKTASHDMLVKLASRDGALTFTAVPLGSELRIGIDRDADGKLDGGGRWVVPPLAVWNLDEASLGPASTTVTEVGGRFPGTAHGGVTTVAAAHGPMPGKTGTCRFVELDGVDDFISFGNPAELNFAGTLTLAAWVRPDRSDDTIRNILAHTHQTNPSRAVFLRMWGGRYEIGSWNGTDFLAASPIPASDIGTGTWVHLAGTYDGRTWRLYRNGIEVARRTAPIGALPVRQNWTLGSFGDGGREFFDGGIDEPRIYNRALTPEQIHALADERHVCSDDADAGLDTDGDGVEDAEDAFPHDPTETADRDGDGVGDNVDAFPDDPNRTKPGPGGSTNASFLRRLGSLFRLRIQGSLRSARNIRVGPPGTFEQ